MAKEKGDVSTRTSSKRYRDGWERVFGSLKLVDVPNSITTPDTSDLVEGDSEHPESTSEDNEE
jgi:hypothetical protein